MSPYSFTQAGTTYDAEDRLTGFARAATSGTPQLSQSWNLSAVGDWNSVTTNGTARSRTHGPTHELLTAGGQGVTHDTKGNMLLIPASVRANSSPLVLTWDFDNRMVSADVGADSVIDVTHQYDALGRRVARTASGSTTVFVQVDQQTICDYTSGAAPASSTYRYLYASYIDEPIVRVTTSNSETTWYHRNQQYSIVACTDSSGAATERYAYTAYGLPTITDGSGTVRTSSAIGNRYTYTGREWDGVLGLYHYRARMYEATVGRFCSRDPIGYDSLDTCLYGFTFANPLFWSDSSGLFPEDPKKEPTLDDEQKKEIDRCAEGQKCGTRKGGPVAEQSGWIECDGKGKPVAKTLPKNKYPKDTDPQTLAAYFGCGLFRCGEAHEKYHIEQISYLDPDVCKDKAKGEIVQFPANCLSTLECRAWQIDFRCLQERLEFFKRSDRAIRYRDINGRELRVWCKDYIENLIATSPHKIENQYKCSELRIQIPPDLVK